MAEVLLSLFSLVLLALLATPACRTSSLLAFCGRRVAQAAHVLGSACGPRERFRLLHWAKTQGSAVATHSPPGKDNGAAERNANRNDADRAVASSSFFRSGGQRVTAATGSSAREAVPAIVLQHGARQWACRRDFAGGFAQDRVGQLTFAYSEVGSRFSAWTGLGLRSYCCGALFLTPHMLDTSMCCDRRFRNARRVAKKTDLNSGGDG